MTASFDLIHGAWITCVGREDQPIELGLQEALTQAHELREIACESPLVTASLHRLLLALLHRIFGPKSYDAWFALWRAGRFDAATIEAYLAHWRDRFDLFDPERPFYQAADDRVKPKPVTSLVHHVASGNNATLFDHHTDEGGLSLSPAQAARYLVAAQAFGLAGLSGLERKFTDGTCTRGMVFLVQGVSLFETLMLNLLRYDADHPIPSQPDDLPTWEVDDPFAGDRNIPRGYLDYLTWQNRRILLIPEMTYSGLVIRQMTQAPGLRLGEGIPDPMKPYRRDEKRGLLPLRFSEDRALWRDSSTLFQLDGGQAHAPRAFAWLAELVDEGYLPTDTRRTVALGMANDQARVDFYRTEHLPLPLAYLHDQQLVNRLRDDVLRAADRTAQQMWGAARTIALYVVAPLADDEDVHKPAPEDLNRLTAAWGIERRYWSRLEVPFLLALQGLPGDDTQTLKNWHNTLYRTAWQAFDEVAEDIETDPRALKAVVRGREQLAAGLAKVLPREPVD